MPEELKFDRGIIFKVLTYKKYSEKYSRAIFSKFGRDKNMVYEILKRRPIQKLVEVLKETRKL